MIHALIWTEKRETENEIANGGLEKQTEKQGEDGEAKKTDSKANRRDKKKNKKKETEDASKIISEIRDSSGKNSDSEEDAEFWMPPAGERWDNDDGGDRWGSGSESGPEDDDANVEGMYSKFLINSEKGIRLKLPKAHI